MMFASIVVLERSVGSGERARVVVVGNKFLHPLYTLSRDASLNVVYSVSISQPSAKSGCQESTLARNRTCLDIRMPRVHRCPRLHPFSMSGCQESTFCITIRGVKSHRSEKWSQLVSGGGRYYQ